MNSRPEAWLKQDHNYLALTQLANDNGFSAQAYHYASQAAEKSLKGALLELGVKPPYTHVLNDLVQRLGSAGVDVSAIEALPIRELSRKHHWSLQIEGTSHSIRSTVVDSSAVRCLAETDQQG